MVSPSENINPSVPVASQAFTTVKAARNYRMIRSLFEAFEAHGLE